MGLGMARLRSPRILAREGVISGRRVMLPAALVLEGVELPDDLLPALLRIELQGLQGAVRRTPETHSARRSGASSRRHGTGSEAPREGNPGTPEALKMPFLLPWRRIYPGEEEGNPWVR